METFQFDFVMRLVPNPYCFVMHLSNNWMPLVVPPFYILEFILHGVLGLKLDRGKNLNRGQQLNSGQKYPVLPR